MGIPNAEKIIERARQGEPVTTKERRHAVAYLISTQPGEITAGDMAEWFGVTDRTIRFDMRYIREERAKLIKEDDIGLVIADIAMTFDNQIRDIEKSKAKCKLGSREHLEHSKAIFDMQLRKVKALQDLGYYPKNLGNMTVEKFEYRATVSKDGAVDTRRVDMFDAEVIETRPEDDKEREALEAEFTDLPALPAAPEDGEQSAPPAILQTEQAATEPTAD